MAGCEDGNLVYEKLDFWDHVRPDFNLYSPSIPGPRRQHEEHQGVGPPRAHHRRDPLGPDHHDRADHMCKIIFG